jgi:secreted trypsin-like serine protease
MEFKLLVLTIAVAVSVQVANCENEDTTTDIKAFAADGKQLTICQAGILNLRYVLMTASCANEVDTFTLNNGNGRLNRESSTLRRFLFFSEIQEGKNNNSSWIQE